MSRCYHKAVTEKTEMWSKFILGITDVTDGQFKTITNLELEKYHCTFINICVITIVLLYFIYIKEPLKKPARGDRKLTTT